MKFSDVKTLLLSSGYMKTSDSGGRKVVDELRDASFERNHQLFAGSDRPEFHKTLDGFEQVSVEKESTNYIDESVVFVDEPPEVLPLAEFYGIKSRFNESTRDIRVHLVDTTKTYTASVWLYLDPNYDFTAWQIRMFNDGNLVEIIDADNNKKGEWQYIELTGSNIDKVEFRQGGSGSNSIRWTTLAKVEEGNYATNWHPTGSTRLAPSPVIENALAGLENGGTISAVVNTIRDDSTLNWIFQDSNNGNFSNRRSDFYIDSNDNFRLHLFGSNGGQLDVSSPFIWDNLERKTFAYVVTLDATTISLLLLDNNKDIHRFSNAHLINETTDNNIIIGRRESSGTATTFRYEKPLHKDNIVRVNATDEEIKQLFEDLTKGTSMELTADQMTIV